MTLSVTIDDTKFIPIKYRIALKDCTKEVEGYAFETPGWPEWHACVRYGNRWGDDLFSDWIVDHFETGLALSGCGRLENPAEAPTVMAKLLDGKGREAVAKVLLVCCP